jgi:hypothetical protein
MAGPLGMRPSASLPLKPKSQKPGPNRSWLIPIVVLAGIWTLNPFDNQAESPPVTAPSSVSVFQYGDYAVELTDGTVSRIAGPVQQVTPAVTADRIGVICRDGWRSSATGGGECSRHHGVSRWLHGEGEPAKTVVREGVVCQGEGRGPGSLSFGDFSDPAPHCWNRNRASYSSNAALQSAFPDTDHARLLAEAGLGQVPPRT